MTFFIGANAENLQKTLNSNLEARHVGWVTCNLDLCPESPKVIKVELRGPDSHLRVRQVKVLGQNEGENLSTGMSHIRHFLQGEFTFSYLKRGFWFAIYKNFMVSNVLNKDWANIRSRIFETFLWICLNMYKTNPINLTV